MKLTHTKEEEKLTWKREIRENSEHVQLNDVTQMRCQYTETTTTWFSAINVDNHREHRRWKWLPDVQVRFVL